MGVSFSSTVTGNEGCTAADSNIRIPCCWGPRILAGYPLVWCGRRSSFLHLSLGLKGAPTRCAANLSSPLLYLATAGRVSPSSDPVSELPSSFKTHERVSLCHKHYLVLKISVYLASVWKAFVDISKLRTTFLFLFLFGFLSRVCSWNGPYKSAISSGFIRLLQLFYKLADSGIFPATSYKRLVHSFTSCYPHRSILSTASHCPPSHTSQASFKRDWRLCHILSMKCIEDVGTSAWTWSS